VELDEPAVAAALRAAGARFALVHGSRAGGSPRPDSDLDVGARWGSAAWLTTSGCSACSTAWSTTSASWPTSPAGGSGRRRRLPVVRDRQAPVADSNGDAVRQLSRQGAAWLLDQPS
jgi:hypothetical protein